VPVDLLPGHVSPGGPAYTPGRTPWPVPWLSWDYGHGVFCTRLVDGGSNADQSSYTTASFLPPVNSLIVIFIDLSITGSEPAVNTVTSSTGLTFELVNSVFYKSSGNNLKLFAYRAMTATPLDPGAVTIDLNAVVHTGARWQIIACSKVKPGANGANAIAQSEVAFNTVAVGGALDVVLPNPRQNDYSRCLAGFGNNSSAANSVIPRAGWHELDEGNQGTPSQTLETQWRLDFFEGTASGIQNSTTLAMGGIAVELLQDDFAVTPPPERVPMFLNQYGGYY